LLLVGPTENNSMITYLEFNKFITFNVHYHAWLVNKRLLQAPNQVANVSLISNIVKYLNTESV